MIYLFHHSIILIYVGEGALENNYPIVAVTGASGAGTTAVQQAFKEIFHRQSLKASFVHGDGFMKYDRDEMCRIMEKASSDGRPLSCYGPDLNDFNALEVLFEKYSKTGQGRFRCFVTEENQSILGQPVGGFTEWQNVPEDTDLLFYEGMHGGVVSNSWTRRKMSESHNEKIINERRKAGKKSGVDVAQYVDMLIGVVPAINLEWIQKIHHDMHCTKASTGEVTEIILSRLQDYIHFIVPQFSLTDINFQRMPVVDTSNPFVARGVPTEAESVVVIRFREPKKYDIPYLLKRLDGAFMSRSNTMVINGGEMQHALDIICAPMIEQCCGR
jgi:phosphoribulokinase